jgi:hypothetical protein
MKTIETPETKERRAKNRALCVELISEIDVDLNTAVEDGVLSISFEGTMSVKRYNLIENIAIKHECTMKITAEEFTNMFIVSFVPFFIDVEDWSFEPIEGEGVESSIESPSIIKGPL